MTITRQYFHTTAFKRGLVSGGQFDGCTVSPSEQAYDEDKSEGYGNSAPPASGQLALMHRLPPHSTASSCRCVTL